MMVSDPFAEGYVSTMARGSDALVMLDADGTGNYPAHPFIAVRNVDAAKLSDPVHFNF
jgi:hypothetical protein